MADVWKTIPDTFGLYSVSSDGRIKRGNKVLKHQKTRGYHIVSLSIKGKEINKYVHRLVAENFIPNPNNKKQVNHRDGNKDNNCVFNLEWVTQSENQRHRYDVLGKYTNPSCFSSSVKIKCLNDNKIFSSIREACRYYCIDNSWVCKTLKNKNVTTVKNITLEKLRKEK